MKTFVLLLFFASLMQSAFLPFNLVLILIICYSFVVEESSNYLASFLGGIFLGLLTSQNLGFWALIFLLITKAVKVIKKLPISSNLWIIIPVAFVCILIVALLEKIFLNQTISFTKVIIETILSLPIYLLVRFWKDRFVIRNEIKLKIRS